MNRNRRRISALLPLEAGRTVPVPVACRSLSSCYPNLKGRAMRSSATDWTLHPGQQASWAAAEGDEVFCAAGSVRVGVTGPPFAIPPRVLCAGQTRGAPAAGIFRAEGVVAGRGRLLPVPKAAGWGQPA